MEHLIILTILIRSGKFKMMTRERIFYYSEKWRRVGLENPTVFLSSTEMRPFYWEDMIKKCEYCNKDFYIKPFWIKTKVRGRFCSMDCRRAYEKKYLNVDIICKVCKKIFTRRISEIGRGRGKLCSIECSRKWRTMTMTGKDSPFWDSVEVKCDLCGKSFYRAKHLIEKHKIFYCSKKCQTSVVDVRYGGKKQYTKYHHQRRQSLIHGGGDLSIKTIRLIYEDNIKKYGVLTCYLCNKPIKLNEDSLEHKTPLVRNGTNNYDNLAIAHRTCNSRKRAKTEEEYRRYLYENDN